MQAWQAALGHFRSPHTTGAFLESSSVLGQCLLALRLPASPRPPQLFTLPMVDSAFPSSATFLPLSFLQIRNCDPVSSLPQHCTAPRQ